MFNPKCHIGKLLEKKKRVETRFKKARKQNEVIFYAEQ